MLDQLPKTYLERLSELYPDSYSSISETLTIKRPLTFRVNTLRADNEAVLSILQDKSIKVEKIPWFDNAFATTITDAKALTDLIIFKEGKIYIQNLSSMIPPLIMDLKPTDTVLDLAAAPGSKTSEIASLMHNQGEILANDKSHDRLYKLRSVLEQQGVTNVKVAQKPGEILWKWYPEYFDKVLVDVPCSMEGRISTTDPDSYKDWSVKKIKVLTGIKKKLLRSAVSSTKVGGEIIYSTCTFSPEENEEVIDWILEKEKEAVEVLPITIEGLELTSGLQSWKGKIYHSDLTKTARIIPSKTMEGFYVAKLRKIKSTVPSLLP